MTVLPDRRPRRTVAALVATLALVLTACSGSDERAAVQEPEPSSSTSLDSIEAQRPRVGDCHRMTSREVTTLATEGTSTDCTHRPTTITVGVGRLTRRGEALDPTSEEALALMRRSCPPALARFLGTDQRALRLSRLTAVWFVPTTEQATAGARWYRCDLVGFSRGDRFEPLAPPSRLRGALRTAAGKSRYGLCGTARPGTKGFERVVCSMPHRWRAIDTIDLGEGRYPGAAKVRAKGDGKCRDKVGADAGSGSSFDYGWEWPTAQQWVAGQRYGYCWAPS